MAVYAARYLDLTEDEPASGERRFRVAYELTDTASSDGSEGEWSRREVVVPIGAKVVETFWTVHSAWRPAAEWAAFFAATRRDVLEALAESDETSVELERSEELADHAPPPDAEAESWPPRQVIVPSARPAKRPEVVEAARSHEGELPKFLPRLSPAKEKIVALWLAGGGASVSLLHAALTAEAGRVPASLGIQLVWLMTSVTVTLFACWISAWLLQAEFGYLGAAAIKLTAIAWAPGAVLTAIAVTMPFLPALNILLIAVLYAVVFFCMLDWLFELDTLEAGATTVMIMIAQYVAYLTLALALY